MSTGNRQIALLEKSKEYLTRNLSNPFVSKASVLLYLNSWDPASMGNAFLKWKISVQNSSAWFLFRFLKNVLSIRFYGRMKLHAHPDESVIEKYDSLLISWCKYSDFDEKGFYHDRYFNSKSDNHRNVLWLLISIDNKVPVSFQSNVRIYSKTELSFFSGYLFVCTVILKKIIASKGRLSSIIHTVSAEHTFAEKIADISRLLNVKYAFRSVIQPYEAQPFQHAVNIELKKSPNPVKTIGYLHSVLPPLPTDLICRTGSPDFLYVHGIGQIEIMQHLLNWPVQALRFTPSLRFKKNITESFSGWIFLPYNFSEPEIILAALESYLEAVASNSLPKMVTRCHPAKFHSQMHIQLMKGIDTILEKYQNRFVEGLEKQISIFIGATAAIIEAVERAVEVIHITADPIFESHQENIWNYLQVITINQYVYEYRLNKPGSYIQLGSEGDGITQMIA